MINTKHTYIIEFEGRWQDTLRVRIKSTSEKGARKKFQREWGDYKVLTIIGLKKNDKNKNTGKRKMSKHYILKDKKAIRIDDVFEWAAQFVSQDRRVAKDTINGVTVSTVFLGLDHQWNSGEPLLFETMVFGGKLDQSQERYSAWEQAEEGHKLMVEKVKQAQKSNKGG